MLVPALRTLVILAAFLFAGAGYPPAALAQTLPHWNVTFPVKGGHGVQRIVLGAKQLTIDRTFSMNRAHLVVPLALIKSVSAPYLEAGAWMIDVQLSKTITFHSIFDNGHDQPVDTNVTQLSFLSKSEAAAGRSFLLSKVPHG